MKLAGAYSRHASVTDFGRRTQLKPEHWHHHAQATASARPEHRRELLAGHRHERRIPLLPQHRGTALKLPLTPQQGDARKRKLPRVLPPFVLKTEYPIAV